MIKCTPAQLIQCAELYKNADSSADAIYDIIHLLNIDEKDLNTPEWCKLLNCIVNKAHRSITPIKASEPHHECCCAEACTPAETCTCHPLNVERMYELCNNVASTYARKNADYGDSFHTSVAKYGLISALTRMSDKWNRLENLILHGNGQVDEALTDTLVDLAAYALMTVMEIEEE